MASGYVRAERLKVEPDGTNPTAPVLNGVAPAHDLELPCQYYYEKYFYSFHVNRAMA